MTHPILVTGGTGTLGRALVDRLLDAGRDVRVLSRHQQSPTARCAVVTGDLGTGAGIGAALAGVSTIVHCATSPRGDVPAAKQLISAAQAAQGTQGTQPHLLYISIVGIDDIPLGYYRSKLAVEALIASSGLPYTVLRATQFHDLITSVLAGQRWSPLVMVPAGFRFQPIDVRDVAGRLVALADGPPAGRAPDIGGPQVRDVRDLARAYLRAGARRRLVVPLPLTGKVARAYRAGGHLTPGHADGTITYEQFLAERFASKPVRGCEAEQQ